MKKIPTVMIAKNKASKTDKIHHFLKTEDKRNAETQDISELCNNIVAKL